MISVIVPAHDKPHRLELTLAGLQGQSEREQFELIVVADNASDSVTSVIEQQPDCRHLITGGLGRSGARNFGANNARGSLLIFVDDDVLVHHNFVNAHKKAQQQNPGLVHGQLREIIGLTQVDDPREGGLGCKPIEKAQLLDGSWSSSGIRVVANTLEQAAERREEIDVPWLACAGANISISKSHWRSVNGFEERYGKRWGMEDIDFAYRLWRAGVPISLAQSAKGFHMSHTKEERWLQHRINLDQFVQTAQCIEASSLDQLLSPNGSVEKYFQTVCQSRQTALSSDC